MDINFALFCTFSLILLFAGFRVITAKSPVAAALNLVLAFANASCIWMLLKVEFLAISLVLVYVGAVMVLFLFVVMMLDIDVEAMREGFWRHFPLAGLVGAVIAVEMIFVLYRGFSVQDAAPLSPELARLGNAKALGVELYSKYLYPVEIAAVILLVAIIAAIALTLRQRKDSRFQSAAEQIKVKKADRLRIVQMHPVKPQSAGEAASAADVKGQA
ncbi:NADH-quinone oxidoreductase subunit J [Aquabacterium sp.]|uniref:NADH-quinone oxidoreductase subunit J n=1 Tax=Aquabacterium sp. TaxID=1872578 RepID=UPI0035B4C355